MAGRELKRILGKGFSIAACIGTIIGLGILRTPGEIAASVSNPAIYMGLWIGGGVRLGGGLYQGAAAGFGLIMIAVAAALIYGGISAGPTESLNVVTQSASPDIAKYGLVAAAIVFTYDGWTGASYFGGEIKGGGRMAALGSIKGVIIVIALYLLLNFALVFSVPLTELQGNDLALSGALDYLFGPGAGTFIIFAAIFILLAHQNINYMMGTRILYALSSDGLGTDRATTVSDRGTPTGSLLFTWLFTSGLILAGGFDFLLNMAALLFITMYVALIYGVFRLRRQEASVERPYEAWGFPATGVICAVFWIAVAIFMAVMDQRSTLYTLGLITVSIPAYLWLKSRRHFGA